MSQAVRLGVTSATTFNRDCPYWRAGWNLLKAKRLMRNSRLAEDDGFKVKKSAHHIDALPSRQASV
ncbi:hypothetical protein [Neisseria shayeganii]|uniref:hypothetical protein n=1 Tax=Neisseria shayeganii TaxID=607712 RepID=UPI0012EA97DB|nr:hypothetical protein [Neisseria shayeganii]